MKYSIFVHVVNCFDHLVDVKSDSILWQVVTPAFYGFVHVLVHEFEH